MTSTNEDFVDESPLLHAPGASKAYTIIVTNKDGSVPTITTTGGSTKIFKRGTGADLSGSLMTGSASASGNAYTTPVIAGLTGGNFYICAFYATINGVVDLVGKVRLNCSRDKADQ